MELRRGSNRTGHRQAPRCAWPPRTAGGHPGNRPANSVVGEIIPWKEQAPIGSNLPQILHRSFAIRLEGDEAPPQQCVRRLGIDPQCLAVELQCPIVLPQMLRAITGNDPSRLFDQPRQSDGHLESLDRRFKERAAVVVFHLDRRRDHGLGLFDQVEGVGDLIIEGLEVLEASRHNPPTAVRIDSVVTSGRTTRPGSVK